MAKGSLRGWLLQKWVVSQVEKHSWLPYGTGVAMTTYAFVPHSVWRALGSVGLRAVSYPARLIPPNVHVRPGLSQRFPHELAQEGRNVPHGYNRAFASTQRLGAMRAAPLMLGGAAILQMSRMMGGWISPDPMITTR